MVSVLASSMIDHGFEPRLGQTKDSKIGIVPSPLTRSIKNNEQTGWLRIRIMCQSVATCLSVDCCFSELAL